MKSLFRWSTPVVLSFSGALLLGACASSKPEYYQAFAPSADASAELSSLKGQLQEAKSQQTDVLAPTHFSEALKAHDRAEKARAQNKDNEKILEAIAESKAHLQKANEVAALSRVSVASVIEARQKALAAHAAAAQPNELAEADEDFRDYTHGVENGNVKMSAGDKAKLQEKYRAIEIKSITFNYLGNTRHIIDMAKSEGAEKLAPQTLGSANQKYSEAEAATMNDPYNEEKIRPLADAANVEANLLLSYTRTAKATAKMSPEERAIYLRKQEMELKNAQAQAAIAQAAGAEKEAQLNDQNAQLSTLEKTASVERKIAVIRKEFNTRDADVFKNGDEVLIRLKNISFKKNDAALRPHQLQTLGNVQEAIKILTPSKVVVEGHTDSTGTAAVNKSLSEERAKVVEGYLVSSGVVSKDKIESVGYGFEKPLSSNKTAKGRAQNRRIDVVLEL